MFLRHFLRWRLMDSSLVLSWHVPPLNETMKTDCCVFLSQYYWWLWDSGSVLQFNPTLRIQFSIVWNWHELVIFLLDKKHFAAVETESHAGDTCFRSSFICTQSSYINLHFTFSKHFLDPLNGYLMMICMVDFIYILR